LTGGLSLIMVLTKRGAESSKTWKTHLSGVDTRGGGGSRLQRKQRAIQSVSKLHERTGPLTKWTSSKRARAQRLQEGVGSEAVKGAKERGEKHQNNAHECRKVGEKDDERQHDRPTGKGGELCIPSFSRRKMNGGRQEEKRRYPTPGSVSSERTKGRNQSRGGQGGVQVFV